MGIDNKSLEKEEAEGSRKDTAMAIGDGDKPVRWPF